MNRSVLQLILQGSSGDLVQAIEQVLGKHGSQVPATATPLPSAFNLSSRPHFYTSLAPTPTFNGSSQGPKSAFSPVANVAGAPPTPLRYPYAPAPRGLAFPMPYPASFLPSLAGISYGYNAIAAAAAASVAAGSQKVGSVPQYGSYPCPFVPNHSDK